MMDQPSLLTDLREFVAFHQVHGQLHAKASAPTSNGYRLEVACPCSVVFERWVFSDDAAIDVALLARGIDDPPSLRASLASPSRFLPVLP